MKKTENIPCHECKYSEKYLDEKDKIRYKCNKFAKRGKCSSFRTYRMNKKTQKLIKARNPCVICKNKCNRKEDKYTCVLYLQYYKNITGEELKR